jgi:predicted Zn-dependent protease
MRIRRLRRSLSTRTSIRFQSDNGINSSSLDFVGTATHEIGHALGFISNNGGGNGVP